MRSVSAPAPPTAVPAEPHQIPAVAAAIARGFQDNEIWAWVIPSEQRRERVLPPYYELMIRRVFMPRGEVWTSTDCRGGALWLPPGGHRLTLAEQLRETLMVVSRAGFAALRRGSRSDATMAQHHPTRPHWYLSTLSVEPAAQRRGYGSALLEPMLARIDAERLPAYLETQRESNIPFYRRFGFELIKHVEIEAGPPLWLMWREPGNAA